MLKFFLLPVFAYLLGSIPWGLVLTRVFTSIDIREHGSGNIGATNVRRVAGSTLGALTLAGDVLKGAIPVGLALRISCPGSVWADIFISLVALLAFGGHLYPVYLKFNGGGKGVATAAGAFFVISPAAGVVVILVFILFVCWWERASVGSLAAAAVLPLAIWKSTGSAVICTSAAVTAIFIYIRHKDNIKRLWDGTEPTL